MACPKIKNKARMSVLIDFIQHTAINSNQCHKTRIHRDQRREIPALIPICHNCLYRNPQEI